MDAGPGLGVRHDAGCEARPGPPAAAAGLLVGMQLPDGTLDAALGLLDPASRSLCGAACATLREACARVDGRLLELLVVPEDTAGGTSGLMRRLRPYCSRLQMLQTLDLTGHAEDRLVLAIGGLLPQLVRLCCTRSPLLTEKALESLAADSGRQALREVDLVFCRHIGYAATIRLRRSLPSLELVRRQPAWLEGRFLTPFAGAGPKVEMHTYYADGSFDFTRPQQSRGYVRYLQEGDGFLYDSLQYCNFGGFEGWPPWGRFLYRPGVALRASSQGDRSVLVAQSLNGMRAPTEWPDVPDDEVPLGRSVLLREDGSRLAPGTRLEDAMQDGAAAMVSRMEVQRLEAPMPPAALVEEIEAFERERAAFEAQVQEAHGAQLLAALEEQLHHSLGGVE